MVSLFRMNEVHPTIHKAEYNRLGSSLLSACQNNNVTTVKILMEQKADVNYKDRKREYKCPLEHACFKGNQEIVQLLLQHPDIKFNFSALVCAVTSNHIEITKCLLNKFPDELGECPLNDFTDELVECLSESLLFACHAGHLDMVKLLIDAKADPLYPGCKALANASENGHTHIVQYLLDIKVIPDHDDHCDALYLACRNNHIDVVRLLIANEKCEFSYRPCLHIAVEHGHFESAKLLLENHTRPPLTFDKCLEHLNQERSIWTPYGMITLSVYQRLNMALLLLQHGANPEHLTSTMRHDIRSVLSECLDQTSLPSCLQNIAIQALSGL